MSALECSDLFLAIKYETNNLYNPIWVRSLNKNGYIPSGVQLVDLIDRVREESFNAKEVKRIEYLLVSRNRTALKKVGKSTGAVDDAVSEESEEEADEWKEEKKVHEKIVCINKL
jgi:DNA-binding transcriptional MerR regulator